MYLNPKSLKGYGKKYETFAEIRIIFRFDTIIRLVLILVKLHRIFNY